MESIKIDNTKEIISGKSVVVKKSCTGATFKNLKKGLKSVLEKFITQYVKLDWIKITNYRHHKSQSKQN